MEISNLNDFAVTLVSDINSKVNEQLITLRDGITTSATEANAALSDRIQANLDAITDIQTSLEAIIGINTAQATAIETLNTAVDKLNSKKVIEIYTNEQIAAIELESEESIIYLNLDDLKIYRRSANDQGQISQVEIGHLSSPEE